MGGSVNRVQLLGYLGRDAELRYTPGGAAVATLNLATTETWNDKQGQKQERTEWSRCILWGQQAESLQPYLLKGKQIFVEGSLQTRKWDDKDGVTRYSTEVKVFRVTLLGGPPANQRNEPPLEDENGQPVGAASKSNQLVDDDIPF